MELGIDEWGKWYSGGSRASVTSKIVELAIFAVNAFVNYLTYQQLAIATELKCSIVLKTVVACSILYC